MENKTTNKKDSISKCLYKLNLIVSYPYSIEILEGMSSNIIRLRPDIVIEEIEVLVDDFLQGKDFHVSKGIQNIFIGIDENRDKNKRSKIVNNNWQ